MNQRRMHSGLAALIGRDPAPQPWSEGDNIPWHEPEFSARMLREHLSQDHDLASRRTPRIEAHVAWIHRLLSGRPSRILDLACGPGLYASRLARLGHTCVGIDYAPASVAYATHVAEQGGLRCTYVEQDLRTADYGSGYDLAMLIYGEFNVFRPDDVRTVLGKAWAALVDGGRLLLEPHTYAAVHDEAAQAPYWYTSQSGLFSDRPHLCLVEHHWNEQQHVRTDRYYVVDAQTCAVRRHAASYQAYTDAEYRALLEACGFVDVRILPSLTGSTEGAQPELIAILAHKGPGRGALAADVG